MIIKKIQKKFFLLKNGVYKSYLHLLYGNKIKMQSVNFGKKFEFDIAAKNFKSEFGTNVSFKRYGIVSLRENANLTVGNNVFFNSFASVNCHYKITIGNDCLFGENVKLYDHNHIFSDKQVPISKQGYNYGEIRIGNNCWIGSNVVILKGVEIGDHTVIGANCVVYKSIPPNTILKSSNQNI